jgi:energy-coupling factor transporter transmembrane protein EcfT
MDKKLTMPLSKVLAGYIFGLGFYFIWCFYFFYEMPFRNDYFLGIVAVVFAITAVYFVPFLLILYVRSFQKVWTSFSLVSIITLLIFFLIPHTNYKIYSKFHDNKLNLKQDKTIKIIDKNEQERKFLAAHKKEIKKLEYTKEKIQTQENRKKELEAKSNNPITIIDSENKFIIELQAKLESERKKNDKLRKQLNETIRKTKSLEEELRIKGDVVVQAKSKEAFSKIKINSEMVNTDSDTKNQETIFKVQIVSSSTRLATNSAQFKGLKNIWEYKDSGLYKYTVGNQKDLKSASELQSEFLRKGFVGAFVVAFRNGKRIPIKKAIAIFKMHGNI